VWDGEGHAAPQHFVKLCFQHLVGRGAVKKVDIKKELKPFYKTSAKDVIFVEVPQMNFLMVDGAGDPNTSADFSDAVEALFSLSYALKFMVNIKTGTDLFKAH
jgi:hypothetical protein